MVFRVEEMASSLGGNDRQRGRSEGLDRVVEDRPVDKDEWRKDERFALRKIVTRVFKDKQRKDVKQPVNTGFKVEVDCDSSIGNWQA